MLKTAWAFVQRDFRLVASYRVAFGIQLLSMLARVMVAAYIGRIIDRSGSPMLANFGGSYFAFLLLGVAFIDYLGTSLLVFANSIRENQLMGTLEMTLIAPIPFSTLLVCSALWAYVFNSLRFVLFLLIGAIVFGFDVGGANVGAAFLMLGVSVACFASMGMVLAAVTLLVKKMDMLVFLINFVTFVLAGVAMPVDMLPSWAIPMARLLPMTHALDALRLTILHGASVRTVSPEIGILLGWTAGFLALALWSFGAAVRWGKSAGTLGHY